MIATVNDVPARHDTRAIVGLCIWDLVGHWDSTWTAQCGVTVCEVKSGQFPQVPVCGGR